MVKESRWLVRIGTKSLPKISPSIIYTQVKLDSNL